MLGSGAEIIANPPKGVDEALLSLIFRYYDHSLKYLSKEMWCTAMALSIEAPKTPSGLHYIELDKMLAAQVTELIRKLQARGDIKSELDTDAIGQLVFNNLNQMFIEFVKDEDMTLETLRNRVATQIRPLTKLIVREGAE